MGYDMSRFVEEGAEEARKNFPTLVNRAAQGQVTVITKHGKACAALVPVSYLARPARTVDIRTLRGSGKGLWGKSVRQAVSKMREEWE
jgi:prevent-host-death family protein